MDTNLTYSNDHTSLYRYIIDLCKNIEFRYMLALDDMITEDYFKNDSKKYYMESVLCDITDIHNFLQTRVVRTVIENDLTPPELFMRMCDMEEYVEDKLEWATTMLAIMNGEKELSPELWQECKKEKKNAAVRRLFSQEGIK